MESLGRKRPPLCGPAIAVAIRGPKVIRVRPWHEEAQACTRGVPLSLPTPIILKWSNPWGFPNEHEKRGLQSLVSVMNLDWGIAGGWICSGQQPLRWPQLSCAGTSTPCPIGHCQGLSHVRGSGPGLLRQITGKWAWAYRPSGLPQMAKAMVMKVVVYVFP